MPFGPVPLIRLGWYSWLPSVVWNEGPGCYIMVNGGHICRARNGPIRQGLLQCLDAYGDRHKFFDTDYWVADNARNRTFQPKLSPKWIRDDGAEMVLIWSDAMKDEQGRSHTVNYRWNQMTVTIETE